MHPVVSASLSGPQDLVDLKGCVTGFKTLKASHIHLLKLALRHDHGLLLGLLVDLGFFHVDHIWSQRKKYTLLIEASSRGAVSPGLAKRRPGSQEKGSDYAGAWGRSTSSTTFRFTRDWCGSKVCCSHLIGAGLPFNLQVNVVNALLERNANFTFQNMKGNTALHIAGKHKHAEVISLLLLKADLKVSALFTSKPEPHATGLRHKPLP